MKVSSISKKTKNIEFLTTAFDLESLELINQMNLKRFKIPSGEITNLPYLRKIGSFGKSIILSTGMSYEREILETSNFLMKNWANHAFLHCNSTYPCPYEDINIEWKLKKAS